MYLCIKSCKHLVHISNINNFYYILSFTINTILYIKYYYILLIKFSG